VTAATFDVFDAGPDADRARLVHGGDAPLPERHAVRAGPLSLVIEAGDVRHVHVGGREVVRRIYGAVRDHAWRTIPARIDGFALDRGADGFRCRYRAEHRQDAVAFVWEAAIEGSADGTLTFAFDGVAEATFERNRIGLCLLHPLPALSGVPVRVTTTDGTQRALRFPDLVTVEQPIAGFHDIAALACAIGPDLWLEAGVEGDVFETEDQRNWIDASTKTYSTPVGLPMPVTVPKGTRIAQRITLRLRATDGTPARPATAPFVIDRRDGELHVTDGAAGRLPSIGIRGGGAVAHVRPAHVRLDLDLTADDAPASLTAAAATQRAASGPPLEIGLRVPADADAAARALARIDLAGVDVGRILAFTAGHDTTQPATLDAIRRWRARQAGPATVPIATGTASDLARIHLAPAPLVAGDAICWSMDPQAHATDLTSIAETPDGARDQVRSVRQRQPGLPLAITASLARQGRPDPRIGSLFAAAWTLALIGALGEAGADSVTLVDAWPDSGDPAALPLTHVLAALTPLRDARLGPVASTLDTVRAVRLELADREVLVVANLAPRACELTLPPAPAAWTTWRLDADTPRSALAAGTALVDPGLAATSSGRLVLGSCGIARLEHAPRISPR
jgi:hypothetical protein